MNVLAQLFKRFIRGVALGLLFGLGESLFLAWRYPVGTGKLFVVKVLVLYGAWGVFMGLLAGFVPRAFRKSGNLDWAITGLLAFSVLASFLIVDRDFFYFKLNAGSVGILAVVFAAVMSSSYVLGSFWRRLSVRLRQTAVVVFLAVTGIGILLPRSKPISSAREDFPQPSAPKKPNVIMILMDALDADRVSFMGHSRPTTPHIDALAKESVVFSEFYSPHSTAPSVTSIFTGLKPETTGYNYVDDVISEKYFLLGEVMQKAGYQTSAFAWTYYIDSLFGFGQGIRHFENLSRLDPAGYCFLKRGLWVVYKEYFPLRPQMERVEFFLERLFDPKEDAQETREELVEKKGALEIEEKDIDEKIRERFLKWLDGSSRQPFFSMLHLQGAHSPFVIPSHFRHRFISVAEIKRGQEEIKKLLLGRSVAAEDIELLHALYDTRLRFSDEVVGGLLSDLNQRGLMANTMIIILGDHGSQVTEQGRDVLHGKSEEDPDRRWEHSKPHAFLMFYFPQEFGGGRRVDQKVLSVDLLPTLAEWAAVPPPGSIDGQSFLNALVLPKAES